MEKYAVDFRNGNLDPHLNLEGWADLRLSPPTPADEAERILEPTGLTLRVTRNLNVPTGTAGMNSVYVTPPDLPLDSRLLLRVTFDLPRAEGFSLTDHGPFGGEVGSIARVSPAGPAALRGEVEQAGGVESSSRSMGGRGSSVPEPWAVALSVSPEEVFSSERAVHLTCQFHRQFNGVRLNTPKDPTGHGSLQNDKGACLESPLNYGAYQGGYMALPDNTDGEVPPPVFTLEHSFCGWNAETNGHTVGCGFLGISRTWLPETRDHRGYSSDAFTLPGVPVTSIGALGVSLVTVSGYGRISVRLLTFEVWLNASM